ncbi:ATP-binding protein [Streptomyces sp. NPDC056707]|uniref:ATP-binding protein n=1 Tax=Streptomyces sp. NPDC056707 TaxID=3345919 RepID=UPI0036C3F8C7
MPDHIAEAAVFSCLAAGILAALILLLRQRLTVVRLRKEKAALADGVRLRDEEAHHLVTTRLRAVTDGRGEPASLQSPLAGELAGSAFVASLNTAVEMHARAVEGGRAQADIAAKAALKAAMRALQGLANEQQLSISAMQDRHDDPDVLSGLLEIDHANSQFGRRAQAIAVLCGSWPGRQRAAAPLTDVVRGAKSRIRDYKRVQLRGQVDIAVVGRAVEPVVLAVAELLDNAARHSQPTTAVEVGFRSVHTGACIVIDDAGVGMNEHQTDQTLPLLRGLQPVDVSRLGDPPQFGFAVIGALAQRYGFSVSVDTQSPYGGVRAVLFLPSELLTHIQPEGPEPRRAVRSATSVPPVPSAPAVIVASPPTSSSTAGGLPKRRRREPVAELTATGDLGPQQHNPSVAEGRSAQETARRLGAFARGTQAGRSAPDDERSQ